MTLSLYIPPIFGYSVFCETLNNPVTDKLLDWEVGLADTEIWVAKRLHIVISNENYYTPRRE